MTQKEMISNVCENLFMRNMARFIGYNTAKGSRMYGTLDGIPKEGCIESPCAESLMVGLGLGMSLDGGYLPVVCFERHEFAVFALGQLAVMGDKFASVTGGVRTPLVVRVIKGGEKPLNPGSQHCGNYGTALMESMPNSVFLFAKFGLTYDSVVAALQSSRSGIVVIMEERDGYEETVA
jgi:pyruvate/2-oxoglutarate/acetoin dehydrogenase E1 component